MNDLFGSAEKQKESPPPIESRVQRKRPSESLGNAGASLRVGLQDGHGAPVSTVMQAFFRESRELTWF